jgi:activator of 2-hydroxyglutaryl-CoA dehydratase
MNAEIITADGTKGVRQQMEHEHFADIESALLHASFLIPIGMRFKYEDMYKLLYSLDYKVDGFPGAVKQLHDAGTLLFGYDPGSWTTKHWYLDRSARVTYEETRRTKHEADEPEKREVSKQLHELAGKVNDSIESAFLDETLKCLGPVILFVSRQHH